MVDKSGSEIGCFHASEIFLKLGATGIGRTPSEGFIQDGHTN